VSWEEDEERFKPLNRLLLKRLVLFAMPHKWWYISDIVVWEVWTAIALLQPDFMRRGIDQYVVPALAGKPTDVAPLRGLMIIAGILAGLGAVQLFLRLIRIYVDTKVSQNVINDIRMSIFRHVQTLSMSYFDRTKQGWIIARADSDLDTLEDIYTWAAPSLAGSILTLIGAVAMMLYYNWRLAAAVSMTLPPLFIITYFFRKRVADAYREVRRTSSRITANIAENISGIRVVQSFVRQDKNLEVFDGLNRENMSANVYAAKVWQSYWPSIGFVGAAGTTIIIWYGTYMIIQGTLTAGELFAFLGYLGMFFGPINVMGRLYNTLLASMAAAERIFKLLDTKPDIVDAPKAHGLPRIGGSVVFERVSFRYDRDGGDGAPWILDDVSVEAKPGQTVAMVGPTGAGKTTIVSLIPRFYDVQKGRILIDGHDIKDVTLQSLHSQMGIVLQDAFLFSGTVMDNIRYARPEASDEEVFEAARRIGSYGILAALPEGFKTEVGERGATISQGQRQLVSFTRAIVADPRVLILDEATASIDTQTEQALQYALERLMERRTSFVVAHRLSTVRNADMVLVVQDGKITERGTHRVLLDAGGAYADMYAEFIKA
jgi:ABC-type multidrug transport system fused ATPase/permease subunit